MEIEVRSWFSADMEISLKFRLFASDRVRRFSTTSYRMGASTTASARGHSPRQARGLRKSRAVLAEHP
jgi:hypothetical protein